MYGITKDEYKDRLMLEGYNLFSSGLSKHYNISISFKEYILLCRSSVQWIYKKNSNNGIVLIEVNGNKIISSKERKRFRRLLFVRPFYKEFIRNKFNGLCAYTGKPLDENWSVDHIIPKSSRSVDMSIIHSDENLFPTISEVNSFKGSMNLEEFRQLLMSMHKFPIKKTKRSRKTQNIARLFDITANKPFCGKFYFEIIQAPSSPAHNKTDDQLGQ